MKRSLLDATVEDDIVISGSTRLDTLKHVASFPKILWSGGGGLNNAFSQYFPLCCGEALVLGMSGYGREGT